MSVWFPSGRCRRIAVATGMFSLMGLGTGLSTVAHASGNIYPAGCDRNGHSANWGSFCYTGVNYNRTGTYVGAVQNVVLDMNLSVTVDCVYGSETGTRVSQYQNLYGLTQDAVVGPNTWRNMRGKLSLSSVLPTSWGGWNVYSVGRDANRFEFQYFNSDPTLDGWFLYAYFAGKHQYVAMTTADSRCGR